MRAVWQVAVDDAKRFTVGARIASKCRGADQKLVVLVVAERGRVLKLHVHVQEIDETWTWRLDPGRGQLPDLACWQKDQLIGDIV
jgi:hypothetical protein